MSITPQIIIAIIILYVAMLMIISYITTKKKADSKSFFTGSRKSPWYVVAIAMVGTSISGVTFISVPGMVGASQFGYLQMALGFVAGYFAIAYVLLPLYYKLNLSSIYTYLDQRFGNSSYKVGAAFFLISKFLGCGVRMYLTAIVLQLIVFDGLGVPFWLNVAVTMVVVWLYTYRGGVRTLVWVDMIQTLSLILAVVICIWCIMQNMGLSFPDMVGSVVDSGMSRIWYFDDVNDRQYFFKQFFAGMFTTIAMTGLDQDMMQKNLSCKNLKDAQKNVISYGFSFLPVNLLFLVLGVLLYQFAASKGCYLDGVISDLDGNRLKPDELFPYLATGRTPDGAQLISVWVAVFFIIGLISAAFSSAGSAVTALTTSFTIDILRADKKHDEASLARVRKIVHVCNALMMGVLIYSFSVIGNNSVIDAVYVVASYTYGPLLGLYFFGLYTRRVVRDGWVPVVCILSPIICLILNLNSAEWFGGYKMGYELLLYNGGITALGLWLASSSAPAPESGKCPSSN
ncbi:MAG: sodium:solute symporter [Bacteroidales bacterium]|nr:sodium:solute symporter [Bacteroidales bacterium]